MDFMMKLARGMQCIYQQQNDNNKIIKIFTSKPLENERTINNKNKILAVSTPDALCFPWQRAFFVCTL